MLTFLTALGVLAGCCLLRRRRLRTAGEEREFCGGRVRWTLFWNERAAFGLPVRRGWVLAASATVLPVLWLLRKRSPIGAGLALGGGISNLWERLRDGRVCDYLQFPKLGRLRRYVWNLADGAIAVGAVLLALLDQKR